MLNRGRIKTTLIALLAAGATCYASACSQSIEGADDDSSTPNVHPERRVETSALNEPPVARFDISDNLPEDGDPVNFDATKTEDPNGDELTYSWRFSDDHPGGGARISHIFADGGDYDVTLTVADEHGATDTLTKTVSIKDTPFPRGNTEVTIIARDLQYHDVEGVKLSPVGSDIVKETNEQGEATFANMPSGDALVFEATKEGYAKQVARMRLPQKATKAPVLIRMQEIGKRVSVDNIEQGAEVHGYDGARLDIPEDGLVDENGNTVTGEITVEFTAFDVSEKPEIGGFPGMFAGLRTDGTMEQILSFGAMEVNLKQDGQDVQVKPGKKVELDIPAYAEGIPDNADIPLWSLDESSGIWIEEGDVDPIQNDASPTGQVMRTEVTHFTTWNGDFPITSPCKMKPKCMIVDKKTGQPTIPLKSNETCEVKVTSGKMQGLGSSCSISNDASRVAGKSCSQKSDCFFTKQVQDCSSGDTCTTKTKKVVPSGITCNTSSLPGGQQMPSGVCKVQSSSCPNVQFCNSGSCALPASGGVFAGASGRFNQSFQIDPKGGSASDLSPPRGQNAWIWVPNVDLQLRGVARKGTLHGATNVEGHNQASKAFKNCNAVSCKEAKPVVPLRHSCGSGVSGLTGNCPKVKRRHFCEMLFRCPQAEFSRSFTQTLGVPNVQECIDKLETDYNVTQLKESLNANRASFNGNRAAKCLDQVAALRHQVTKSVNGGSSRASACAKFDAKAFEINACTGVEGTIPKGNNCAHDLECKDKYNGSSKIDRSCSRGDGTSSCLGTCKRSVTKERTCGSSNKTCDYGEFCDNGSCVAKKTTAGAKCSDEYECGAGLFCDTGSGKCKRQSYGQQTGQACSQRNMCSIGLSCSYNGRQQSTCRRFSKAGGPCSGENVGGGTAGCLWKAFCTGSSCKEKLGHGATCETDQQCMSGVCRGAAGGSSGTCFGPKKALSCGP